MYFVPLIVSFLYRYFVTDRRFLSSVYLTTKHRLCRSQWLRGLMCGSVTARLLRLWVRIPPETWTFVCYEFCVLSGRGLCDELITRPESHRVWCVVLCDIENLGMRRPWPTGEGGELLGQIKNIGLEY